MPVVDELYEQLGMAFSIVGLALVVPSVFLFKQYFRFLDHVQLVLLYSLALVSPITAFAKNLTDSWTEFFPNILEDICEAGDMVCTVGYALSFTVCLVGLIALTFTVISIEKCVRGNFRIEPAHQLLKGLFKWTYLPLSYYALFFLINDINDGTDTNLISSAVVTAWLVVFPTVQLVFYKVYQDEKTDIWLKWFEFMDYVRLFSIALILVCGGIYEDDGGDIAKYFAYGPLIAHAAVFLWKNSFHYPILERVLHGLGEAIAIAIFSLFIFDKQMLADNEVDFFGLAAILLLDVIHFIVRLVVYLKHGNPGRERVNPEDGSQEELNKSRQQKVKVELAGGEFSPKRNNKYDESSDELGLQNSRGELKESVRRGNQRRRR